MIAYLMTDVNHVTYEPDCVILNMLDFLKFAVQR
jgi:hypothetical protein